MKNLFLMLGGVALFIIIVGLLVQTSQGQTNILSKYLPKFSPIAGQSTPVPNLKEITIGKTKVSVVLANTEATREKGLGGVINMPDNQGMLFVFDTKNLPPSKATFWMKGMRIPLDFIWISNNKVSEINVNVPAPDSNTPDSALQIIAPSQPIDYILEVNAGFTLKNNIKVGDQVVLNL